MVPMHVQVNWDVCDCSSLVTASCLKGYSYWHTVVTHLYLSCLRAGVTLPRLSAEGGCGSTSTFPGFQPHLTMTIQLYQTSSSVAVVQVLQIMLWCLNMGKC